MTTRTKTLFFGTVAPPYPIATPVATVPAGYTWIWKFWLWSIQLVATEGELTFGVLSPTGDYVIAADLFTHIGEVNNFSTSGPWWVSLEPGDSIAVQGTGDPQVLHCSGTELSGVAP